MFACFYAVMTGATTSFHDLYHLNDIQTGLMYISIGFGGTISAFTTGRLVDWYSCVEDTSTSKGQDWKLRCPCTALYYMNNVATIAYGWDMGREVHLVAPIVLLFIAG